MCDSSTTFDFSLIKSCIAGNRKSQKKLYDALAPKMFPVCLKFFKRIADAEDVLQEGFIKLFNNLHSYRGEGSFEGWVRRIFVNTAIQFYRNQKPASLSASEYEDAVRCCKASPLDKLYEKDVVHFLNTLSNGYRTVFNLYAVQGYSHREIADMMGISESTSKSQYLRAKAAIRDLVGERA